MRRALVAALILLSTPAFALNKQGARQSASSTDVFNLTGYLFGGVFVFNPTYAARPNNTGRALFRFGLHVDLDLYKQWLTFSYDENTFTDGSDASRGIFLPSEHDHILGLLSTIPLKRGFSLTLAVHWEIDATGFEANPKLTGQRDDYLSRYSQQYVDAYGRVSWSTDRGGVFVALGGFVYNPSYAARPDNSGLALLRYVLHGDFNATPWLALRLDFNFFTDRDTNPALPSELDLTSEVAFRYGAWEWKFVGEADLNLTRYHGTAYPPLGTPGLNQMYLALLMSWSFDARNR